MAKPLGDYDKKRDFAKTPEPPARRKERRGKPVFVVHRHEARRLHYDLRLEMQGVLRSWAVPKGFSYDPEDKHLAVQTEDHPILYESFEGVIPKGQYGAGTMLIWDKGRYRAAEGRDVVADVEGGEVKVVLAGRRLRGEWHLVKTNQGPDTWLLFKARDRYAGTNPFSRGIDFQAAEEAPFPRSLKAMQPAARVEPFSDPSWLFELRCDGQRVLCNKRGDEVRFRGRPRLAAKVPDLVQEIAAVAAENAVLDGVLLCTDERQRPSRQRLADRLAGKTDHPVFYYVFDLPYYEEWDVRSLPLIERKAALASLVSGKGRLQYVDHVLADGGGLVEVVAASGLSGVIAKECNSPYVAGASDAWREIEVRAAAGARQRSFTQALSESAAERADSEARVELSNLSKVFWPGEGYTKGDLLSYYGQVADFILPYLRERPCHLNRYPDGIEGKSFYQKQVPDHFPDWIATEVIGSRHGDKAIRYAICNDRETLLYLVNTGSIELHPWLSRRATPDNPDFALLDLDPKQAPFSDVVRIARTIGKILRGIGLRPYLKTSGKTGLHVVVPLVEGYTYDHSRGFCEGIARVVVKEHKDIATIERTVGSRGRKVYVDFLQNRRGQTIVPPYCVRPVPGATVSAPLDWDELDSDLAMSRFTIRTMLPRLAARGDLYRPVLTDKQDLLPAIDRLQRYLRK